MPSKKMSRRGLFRSGAVAGRRGSVRINSGAGFGGASARARTGRQSYESIGVTPIVNCRGHVHHHHRSQTLPGSEARHGRRRRTPTSTWTS